MTQPQPVAGGSASVPRSLRTLPWEQHPGENDLWYGRFIRYVALGPGRSISLVAKGRRNAYPVPAHWPVQAKQLNWLDRARAFDEAIKADATVREAFVACLLAVRGRLRKEEADKLMGVDYVAPPPEEDYEDEPQSSAR